MLKVRRFGKIVAVKKINGLLGVPEEVKEEAAMQVRLVHPAPMC